MRLKCRPHGGGEHQAVLLPMSSCQGAFLRLALLLAAKRLYGNVRQLQRPP
jgi:hypothetical protein